jgi:hypothetical protein
MRPNYVTKLILASSMVLLLLTPGYGLNAKAGPDGLGRWGSPGPSHSNDEKKEVEAVPALPTGRRTLKVNERAIANDCEANPMSCMCPAGSTKTTFWESAGWMALSKLMLTCVPSCNNGEILRKRPDLATGRVTYKCEKALER